MEHVFGLSTQAAQCGLFPHTCLRAGEQDGTITRHGQEIIFKSKANETMIFSFLGRVASVEAYPKERKVASKQALFEC